MQSSLCWLLVVLVLVPHFAPSSVLCKPTDPEQLAAMADTLKYLQELDRYYSQVARPRFGKRAELRPLPDQDSSPDDSWRRYVSRR